MLRSNPLKAPITAYYKFQASGEVTAMWDAIVTTFAASDKWECEVVGVPDGMEVPDGTAVHLDIPLSSLRYRLLDALVRNGLKDQVRIRTTIRQGGRVWLQKVGAEHHPELLESEKVIPRWSKKKTKD